MPLFEEKDEDGKYKDSDVLTMHILPPDELHLLLGINHFYKDLLKVWPDAEKWAKKCHVFKKGRSQEFDGPGCNNLLKEKSLADLESMAPSQHHGFVTGFRQLAKIVKGCFGLTVSPNKTSFDYNAILVLYALSNFLVAFQAYKFSSYNGPRKNKC